MDDNSMRAEAHQSQPVGVGLLVDQDQVGRDVAVAVIDARAAPARTPPAAIDP